MAMEINEIKQLIEQGSQCNEMLGACVSPNADGSLGAHVGWQAAPPPVAEAATEPAVKPGGLDM